MRNRHVRRRSGRPAEGGSLLGDGVDDQAGDIVLGVVGQRHVLEGHGGLLGVVERGQDARQVVVGDDAR